MSPVPSILHIGDVSFSRRAAPMRQEGRLCPATRVVSPLLLVPAMISQDDRDGLDVHASQVQPMDGPAEIRKAKKRAKLRGVWISFIGRIVAQVLGAVASIACSV